MFLNVPQTATGAAPGVAEWIRKAAGLLNLMANAMDGKIEWSSVPASASDPGEPGQVAYESGFLYVCVATDTWERVALAPWP